jgi:hypothetical protein
VNTDAAGPSLLQNEATEENMKKLVSKLALAAALASAVPALAHACDDDRRPAPPFARGAAMSDRDGPYAPDWRDSRDERLEHRRQEGWRFRRMIEVREERARLERARDRFYATPHRRYEIRQFEEWYGTRRADLDRRMDALRMYASR